MTNRIYLTAAEVLYSGGGESHVMMANVQVLHNDQKSLSNSLVFHACTQVLHGDQQNLPFGLVFHSAVEVLTSTIQQISQNSVGLNFGDSEVFDFQVRTGFPRFKALIPDRERNPHPTTILASDLEERQRTIRDQHNKAQAGDTTFDYGLLLKPSSTREYTLGAVGKFYHDDYGMIHARYVQIADWVSLEYQGVPVGHLRDADAVDWRVTNDYAKSGADLVMGMTFFGIDPQPGEFGWVVVYGANPYEIEVSTARIPQPDDAYCWTGTGKIGLDSPGKIIARRWGESDTPVLGAGALKVELEGLSPTSLTQFVSELQAPTVSAVEDLTQRATTAEGTIEQLRADTNSLRTDSNELLALILQEQADRTRDVQSLRLDFAGNDWAPEILEALNIAREEFNAADDLIRVSVSEVKFLAEEALAASGSGAGTFLEDLDNLTIQVNVLQNRLVNLNVNYPVPMAGDILFGVDAIDPFGAPIVLFEGVQFTLENLLDVDVTTAPPADGDQLTWDSSLGKWVPDSPGSGGGGGSGVEVLDEGSTVLSSATEIDFVGAGVSVGSSGSRAIVTIPGGGGGGGGASDFILPAASDLPLTIGSPGIVNFNTRTLFIGDLPHPSGITGRGVTTSGDVDVIAHIEGITDVNFNSVGLFMSDGTRYLWNAGVQVFGYLRALESWDNQAAFNSQLGNRPLGGGNIPNWYRMTHDAGTGISTAFASFDGINWFQIGPTSTWLGAGVTSVGVGANRNNASLTPLAYVRSFELI